MPNENEVVIHCLIAAIEGRSPSGAAATLKITRADHLMNRIRAISGGPCVIQRKRENGGPWVVSLPGIEGEFRNLQEIESTFLNPSRPYPFKGR